MDASSTPTGAAGAESEYRYWAFISYSHQDEQWAQWLHTSLETYRIPKALRNRIAALGPDGPVDRLFPVFRDRDELGGGFDLNERLRLALRQSRFLIVICAPHSAQSRYVQQEIEAFEAFGRELGDRLRGALVEQECRQPAIHAGARGDSAVAGPPGARSWRRGGNQGHSAVDLQRV